jgi:hypothetical protein
MPQHLVERINASLAAEQAQRAAQTSDTPVLPLLARRRSRPARHFVAIAGTAAAVVLATVVGTTMFTAGSISPTGGNSLTSASKGEADVSAQPGADAIRGAGSPASPPAGASAASPQAAAGATAALEDITPSQVHLSQSGTRYTKAGFVTQAQTFNRTPMPGPTRLRTTSTSPGAAKAYSMGGLIDCLGAIAAGRAQVVRADAGFYEGRPALIIVATTGGRTVAYAVGNQCSHTDALVLHPATSLS